MSRIIFATGNTDKMAEIREILKDLGMEILSMKEAGVNPEIVENGKTFEENSLIKARAVHALLPDDVVMADDSGLEIDYLNKEPEFIPQDIWERILLMISRTMKF